MLKKVRIDKWLWSVRIFKTRTLSTDSCKSNKVKMAGKPLKPSFLLERGELIEVRKNGFDMIYKVVDLLDKRASAPVAEACYENLTPEEEMNKYNDWYIGKQGVEQREKGSGRPTKRERRDIDRHKGEVF